MKNKRFPGLPVLWYRIEKYCNIGNKFILILELGQLYLFEPEDKNAFLKWLKIYDIPSVESPTKDMYFTPRLGLAYEINNKE